MRRNDGYIGQWNGGPHRPQLRFLLDGDGAAKGFDTVPIEVESRATGSVLRRIRERRIGDLDVQRIAPDPDDHDVFARGIRMADDVVDRLPDESGDDGRSVIISGNAGIGVV